MNDDRRGGVKEVHSARHVQRDPNTTLPGNLHRVVLLVLVDRVVQQIEQIAVVAVFGDQTHRIHHQPHKNHDVRVPQRAHQHHFRVEIADRLRRHSANAQLLHGHFAPAIHSMVHDREASHADSLVHFDLRPSNLDPRQLQIAQRRLQRRHHFPLQRFVRLALRFLDSRLVVHFVFARIVLHQACVPHHRRQAAAMRRRRRRRLACWRWRLARRIHQRNDGRLRGFSGLSEEAGQLGGARRQQRRRGRRNGRLGKGLCEGLSGRLGRREGLLGIGGEHVVDGEGGGGTGRIHRGVGGTVEETHRFGSGGSEARVELGGLGGLRGL